MAARSPGLGPAVFASGLIAMFLLGLVGVVGSTWGALTPDPLATQVSTVIGTPHWRVFHDHSPAMDGTAGCAVTDQAVVRWDDGAVSGQVPLRGAVASYRANRGVDVRGADGTALFCPFGAGEGGEDFAEWIIADGAAMNDGAKAPRDPRLSRP